MFNVHLNRFFTTSSRFFSTFLDIVTFKYTYVLSTFTLKVIISQAV